MVVSGIASTQIGKSALSQSSVVALGRDSSDGVKVGVGVGIGPDTAAMA